MNLVKLTEHAAEARGDPPVPRDFMTEAVERVKKGLVEVPRYPNGEPTLRGIYDLAKRLSDGNTG